MADSFHVIVTQTNAQTASMQPQAKIAFDTCYKLLHLSDLTRSWSSHLYGCRIKGGGHRRQWSVTEFWQFFLIIIAHLRNTCTVWVKKKSPPPEGSWHFSFFHKRLRIFNRFFTHLLYVPIYARLQIFIQLYPILTKLCHIKRNYPVHIICSKCPLSAETHALTRLRKSLIALLIVVCGK